MTDQVSAVRAPKRPPRFDLARATRWLLLASATALTYSAASLIAAAHTQGAAGEPGVQFTASTDERGELGHRFHGGFR